ncbi:MAG: ABC transporter substrate-binding protein [Gammaproteobacteria bacterium]|nr:ABC transporter substrate-binding protein [Gammaproteobacteria bacterium]
MQSHRINRPAVKRFLSLVAINAALLISLAVEANWNSPYPTEKVAEETLFSAFSTPPKHLDPVVSYSSNEWAILSQVYEPPLQYHYLKRPYTLEPLTLSKMPELIFLDKDFQKVTESSPDIAYSQYLFTLKPNIKFHTHPAFVQNKEGEWTYHKMSQTAFEDIDSIADFELKASRTLLASDYVYAIKRMALRQNHSPILDSMMDYIEGLKQYSDKVTKGYQQHLGNSKGTVKTTFYDLNKFDIKGVEVIDSTHYSITIKGRYPQFMYWLSMNFFSPIAWEVDAFYKQPGLVEKNLTLDTSPVGTGPYQLVENNPNKRLRLLANPDYRIERYPSSGLPQEADASLLEDAGKPLPFIKEVIYSLEKESVPLWNKFLQGYYDASGVSSDSFDQAVNVSNTGSMSLTAEMTEKGIQFLNMVEPSVMYFGFNMADPVVGGYSDKQRKLRQAISIAVNYEEYVSIFLNGRGVVAHGPVPPGIPGYVSGKPGLNSVIFDWVEGQPIRKSLLVAKQLLTEAGYPDGRMSDGKPLTLYYDTASTGADSQSVLNWYRKQFAKLGIELVIRATDYNRFQDKVRGAKVQMFSWGWNADYPDPENFLFLLFGGNATIHTDGAGINSSNYDNPEFNALFLEMKTMENGPKRQGITQKMIKILQEDSPWIWGYYPKSLALYHHWLHNVWPNPLANNTVKYRRIDAEARQKLQAEWNQPVLWPFGIVIALILLSIYPLIRAYRKRQHRVFSQPTPKEQD